MLIFLVSWIFSLFATQATLHTTQNTLVITNDKSKYSKFLSTLSHHTITFTNSEPTLFNHKQPIYNNIVLLYPSIQSLGGILKTSQLLDFVNAGGNVIVTASSAVSDPIRDFAIEFSVDYDEKNTQVFDPFNSNSLNNTIVSSHFVQNSYVLSPTPAPILFRGVAHKISGRNPLVFPLLTASPSAYSYLSSDHNPISGTPILGKDIGLVTCFQARNNARVVFTGSADMFSDELINQKITVDSNSIASGNLDLISQITQWAFQEKSVLALKNAKHHRQSETRQHGIYRIEDDMIFSVDVLQKSPTGWGPARLKDAQFEAIMLEPYIRTPLLNSANGTHHAKFKLPQQYGVYTFKFTYNRHGLSFIEHSETVQVKPYRHDEYPRFLLIATPYYVATGSMMVSFVVLSALFLYHRDTTKVKKN